MVWTAPMTAVANAVWTSAQYNTYVRDNLLASEANAVSTSGQMVWSTAANTLTARTAANSATVATSQTTASTTYADLATVGPQIAVTTGTAALVYMGINGGNTTLDMASFASYQVSGASSITAVDDWAVYWDGAFANYAARIGAWHYVSNLTAGSNTFTMKYKVQGGTGTFLNRELIVFPI